MPKVKPRMSKRKNKEGKRCKRCGEVLSEGHFRWCSKCLDRFQQEYKHSDPVSDYKIHWNLPDED